MKKAQPFDLYQIVTDQIIEFLEQGTVPWRKQWESPELPSNAVTNRSYRGINTLFLASLPYGIPRYLTWNQLKEFGGAVKRGEQGYMVVYWQVQKKVANKETTPDQLPSEKPKLLLRYYRVFNVLQCEGLPDEMLESTAPDTKQLTTSEAADAILIGMPNKPIIDRDGTHPCYIPECDTIRMPPINSFESTSAYYGTLFHELIHSTGHASRLNRNLVEGYSMKSESYANEELIAEIGACFLNRHAGLHQAEIENSVAYIAGWLAKLKNDKRLIIQASAKAQQATDYILNTNVQAEQSHSPE